MEKLKLFLIYLAAFLLQGTVLNAVAVFGVTPNILLVLTIVYTFFFKDFQGLTLSVIFGILQDVFFGQIIGVSALIYLAVGMLLKFWRNVYRDNKILLLVITVICTAGYALLECGIYMMMQQRSISLLYVMKRVPLSVVWNYIVLLAVLPLARKREGFKV